MMNLVERKGIFIHKFLGYNLLHLLLYSPTGDHLTFRLFLNGFELDCFSELISFAT
jgi:hypothetical protein